MAEAKSSDPATPKKNLERAQNQGRTEKVNREYQTSCGKYPGLQFTSNKQELTTVNHNEQQRDC